MRDTKTIRALGTLLFLVFLTFIGVALIFWGWGNEKPKTPTKTVTITPTATPSPTLKLVAPIKQEVLQPTQVSGSSAQQSAQPNNTTVNNSQQTQPQQSQQPAPTPMPVPTPTPLINLPVVPIIDRVLDIL